MSRSSGIDDFTFVSEDAFVLVRPSGTFEVYTFPNPIPPAATPTCHASYAFPALAPGYMYWYITMSSNPSPGAVPRAWGSPKQELGQQLYYPRSNERIHACCLYVFNPTIEDRSNRVHCFVFFVNLYHLLNPPPSWTRRQPGLFRPMYPRYAPRRPVLSVIENTSINDATQVDDEELAAWNDSLEQGSHQASSASFPADIKNFPTVPLPTPRLETPHPPQASGEPHSWFAASHFHHSGISSGSSSRATRSSGWKPAFSQGPIHIPWSIWGPSSTRWFQESLATDWQHSVYGLRTAETVTPEKLFGTAKSALFAPHPLPMSQTSQQDVQPAVPHAYSSSLETLPSSPVVSTSGATPTEEASSNGTGPATEPPALSNSPELLVNLLPQLLGNVPDIDEPEKPVPLRYLRVRDYNPYAVSQQRMEDELRARNGDTKGKDRMSWREPRIVTEASITPVKGVFTHDIKSSLPYVEVVSEEMFEVTDVMMDDSRMLLLKVGAKLPLDLPCTDLTTWQRGENGKLRRVDVLTM
jgi:hypothetical protein